MSNFAFKQFNIAQSQSSMKVNTDGILLGAWADVSQSQFILDIGTGNGLIALMLAQRNSKAKVTGVEIDEGSGADAQYNAKESPYSDRVSIVVDSIQSYANHAPKKFDHIVSNPPFFTGGTFSTNENKKLVRHTVKLPHGDLLVAVNKLLIRGGMFSLILPILEGYRFEELAHRGKLYLVRKCTVYGRVGHAPERFMLTFSNEPSAHIEESSLAIHYKDTDDYTKEFIALTKDFYLNM